MMNVASEKSGIVKRCQKRFLGKILHQKENLQFAFNPTLFYWSNYNDNNFVWEMQKSGSLHRMCHQQVQIEACRVFKNHSKCLVFELDHPTYKWCNEHTVCSISIVWPLLLPNLHTCSCKSVLYDLWFVQLLLLKKLNSRREHPRVWSRLHIKATKQFSLNESWSNKMCAFFGSRTPTSHRIWRSSKKRWRKAQGRN